MLLSAWPYTRGACTRSLRSNTVGSLINILGSKSSEWEGSHDLSVALCALMTPSKPLEPMVLCCLFSVLGLSIGGRLWMKCPDTGIVNFMQKIAHVCSK
jgi:hypothetical protein